MAIPVDFISLIKDIRGNLFDPATGLPINGKWFDIKGWHTTAGISAAQVATDLAATIVAKNSASASATLATSEATEAIVASDAAQTYKAAALVSENNAAASNTNTVANAAAAKSSADVATLKATDSSSSADLSAGSAIAASTSSTNAATSATASAASATSATLSASIATTSKDAAVVAEGNALTYSINASTSATNSANSSIAAATSATTASTKATEAVSQRNLAANWAIGAEDVLVNDGINPTGFSAYHWAQKAVAVSGGVTKLTQLTDLPGTLVGSASKYLRINSAAGAVEFVDLTKTSVGLGEIDNTSDANKPVSTATQTALNGKVDTTDLATQMLTKAGKGANNDITSLTGLTTALSSSQGGTGLAVAGNYGNVLTSDGTVWVSSEPSSTFTNIVKLSGVSLQEAKTELTTNEINVSLGNYFTKTIILATSLTVSNVPINGTVASVILDLTNGGAFAVTWWANMKWAAGNPPNLTASGRDILGFFTHDGGTTWNGLVLAKDIK